jgi:hypothetical protein
MAIAAPVEKAFLADPNLNPSRRTRTRLASRHINDQRRADCEQLEPEETVLASIHDLTGVAGYRSEATSGRSKEP